MTPGEREEIEKVARKIIPDDSDQYFIHQKIDWTSIRYRITQSILTQVEKARAEERERCAKIAETPDLPIDIKYWMGTKKVLAQKICQEIAKLIRNKLEKE